MELKSVDCLFYVAISASSITKKEFMLVLSWLLGAILQFVLKGACLVFPPPRVLVVTSPLSKHHEHILPRCLCDINDILAEYASPCSDKGGGDTPRPADHLCMVTPSV